MLCGPRKVTLPFENAHDLFGLVHRAPQDIPNIGGGDLQMTYFSQEFANVLGRTSPNHLARPQDHGSHNRNLPSSQHSTPTPRNGKENTSPAMSQSQTHSSR